MQFTPLSNAGVPNITAELAAANLYPLIRTFTVGEGTSSATPLMELKTILQNWSIASNTSIGGPGWSYTSAVCWFTYRNVFNELGGSVPQGIIGNNWGGTPIQHWSSPDALQICNGGTDSTLWNAMVLPYVTGPMVVRTAIWYQVSSLSYTSLAFPFSVTNLSLLSPILSFTNTILLSPFCSFAPTNFFSPILTPSLLSIPFLLSHSFVTPFLLFFYLHYQGESNVGQASYYDCQFTAMISDWRAKIPSLSTFGFIQIAAYTGYGNAPGGDLRQAQLSPLKNLPRIAFASAIDLVYPYSAPGDIHPIAKQLISKRLSDSLLSVEYSITNTGPSVSPFYSGATAKTNGVSISVSVTLTGCVDGCSATQPYFVPPGVTDAQAAGFQIQTNDAAKTWWNVTANMSSDGNSIILSVTAPTTGLAAIASAYGRATWPVVTHYNSIGLPVIPWCFTIEGIPCYTANNAEDSGPSAPRFEETPRTRK